MDENQYDASGDFFKVRLDLFEGPIDLLLHLVKQRELPLEKLSLSEVTEQYLACIENLEQIDLELAGEYLLIAATLLSIKSSILLNEPVEFTLDEDGQLVDPHDELLQKLREAQIYKEGALMLSQCKQLGVDVFPTPSAMASVPKGPVTYRQHDPMLLGQAFRKLLLELGEEEKLYTIQLESISIVERMSEVINVLNRKSSGVSFRELVPDLTSRAALIGTFVALLELCKRQVIQVIQPEANADIEISLAANAMDPSVLANAVQDSEFDVGDVVVHG